ncbi:DUF2510 domain-containing protein [Kitasatospora sp. NPDC088346]|uniref:DUF2510 domain-containing protein n=1 Tax=Kitasatospora sp. NPDC088346 TaxID=3364073 RepID=UPI0038274A8C
MSEQIPAGWYPDPKDTTTDPRPERWWDGTGWTTTTRPAQVEDAAGGPEDRVLEGHVLGTEPTVQYPGLPLAAAQAPAAKVRTGPGRAVLLAASVAALIGLAVGSGVTYLVMDGRSGDHRAVDRPGGRPGSQDLRGPGGGPGGTDGGGEGAGRGGGKGGGPGSGRGGGQGGGPNQGGPGGGGKAGGPAVDSVNRISLPVPDGWKGGTTSDGFAALTIGAYTCSDGTGSCSLGGVVTGKLAGTDAKQAAQADIVNAVKESYGDVKSHEELKSEQVTVAGHSGYLVRWKVDAAQGNDGYVETVVFPTADGKQLTTVHLGFDIDGKAPDVKVMDTIVTGIAAYDGPGPDGGSGGTRT